MKFKKQGFNKLISFALAFTFHFTITRLISFFLLKAEFQIKFNVFSSKLVIRLVLSKIYDMIKVVNYT